MDVRNASNSSPAFAVGRLGWAFTVRPRETLSQPNSQQISQLFETHGPHVHRRAQRLLGNASDAEEATQEIFIRIIRGASDFRHQSQLTTWLYQITTNYCLNLLRDRRRRTELHDGELAPAVRIQGEVAPARSDDLALLRGLLAEGDPKQTQAAVYVYLDGMSHDEAAGLLGVSKRTVGNLLERFSAWAKSRETQLEDAPPGQQAASSGGRS